LFLLVCRRGAALGLSLIDFLLHRRRRGRGGDCVITKSMPNHQRRGEQQGERSDSGRELHGDAPIFFPEASVAARAARSEVSTSRCFTNRRGACQQLRAAIVTSRRQRIYSGNYSRRLEAQIKIA